jgi:hypothetical protein
MKQGDYVKWVDVNDRLPEIKYSSDGSVNMVMVYQKDGFECSGDIQIWNTVWLHNHKCSFTHWMSLPDPPASSNKG